MGAFIRYRLAAEMGYRTALANIGYIYEHGIEDEKMQVPVDLSRAMHFYELCAQQNDAVCRRRLGDMYYYGHGVLINYTAAAQQYRLNLNDPQSCFNLAWLTERGLGVTQDREEARHLYARASSLGPRLRSLAYEASPSEFSEMPAQMMTAKLELQDEVCLCIRSLLALLAPC